MWWVLRSTFVARSLLLGACSARRKGGSLCVQERVKYDVLLKQGAGVIYISFVGMMGWCLLLAFSGTCSM